MPPTFTPATERVLQAAAQFGRSDAIDLPAVLLGLLSETECLAAALLNEQAIDQSAVLARFPQLNQPIASPEAARPRSDQELSGTLERAIAAVTAQCADLPLPPELATEHLLLGILLADGDVAHWLTQQGLDAGSLEQRIRARYQSGPSANSSIALDEPLPCEDGGENGEPAADTIQQRPAIRSAAPRQTYLDAAAAMGEFVADETPSNNLPATEASRLAAWRVLDAAANRAREGLRVVEDYVRFALDDRHLTGELKRLRHDLAGVLDTLPSHRLHAARDTVGDVGTQINTPAELQRGNLETIVTANFLRALEALRSLEEFGKLAAPQIAPRIEQLRYRAYTLQRAVVITSTSLHRLAAARLYVLIDGGSSLADCEQLARSLVGAGVHVLQLRDKRLDDRRLLERARSLRQITAGTSTLLVINDRPDVAALVAADGVHLGQEDVDVRDARTIVGADALIGVSTHSLEQAERAVLDGANYLGVGPTFCSGTKQFAAFTGLELLRTVAGAIRLPAFAIGGIAQHNLAEVRAAGFTRVAVSGAVVAADDPACAAAALLHQLALPAGTGLTL